MSDSSKGGTRWTPEQLAAYQRQQAHQRELASDEANGHRQDGGISPLALSEERKVQFDPN